MDDNEEVTYPVNPTPGDLLHELLRETRRLHERMDQWETTVGGIMAAAKANPMFATVLRANGVHV